MWPGWVLPRRSRKTRGERLIRGELVAIDGSKFVAVASKRRVVSRQKLERQVAALDADIARYLPELEAADAAEQSDGVPDARARRETLARLKDKLTTRHTD